MGVHQVVILFPGAPDLLTNAVLIHIACGVPRLELFEHLRVHLIAAIGLELRHQRRNLRPVLTAQVKQQALQVGGDQDIHGRRNRLVEVAAGDIVHAGVDEIGEHVVLVAGADQPAQRQTRLAGVVRGEDVAEVAGRHAEVDPVAHLNGALGEQVGIGGEVIDDLRHEAAEIDGVRGGQHAALRVHLFGEIRIGEDLLHAALRVVKVALHGDDVRVAAAGGHHLQALRLGDAAVRIEHAAAGARHVEEALQRRLARVPAGGDEDEHLARLAVLFAAQRQQVRQKLQRHVLERQRRAVPQLQRMRPGTHLRHRRDSLTVKARAVCAGDRVLQLLGREVRQEAAQHEGRALLIVHFRQRADLLRRERREFGGHIEAAVRREAAQDGHGRGHSGGAAGGKHLHQESLLGIDRAKARRY